MVKIVAEIGTSHGGDLEKARDLIKMCKAAGVDAVKMQCVIASEILHKRTGLVTLPGGKTNLYQEFSKVEQGKEFYLKCKKMAEEAGLTFISSIFGKKSLADILEIGTEYIKIASPEINYIELLEEVGRGVKEKREEGKACNIVLSSGVSTLGDIDLAIDTLKKFVPPSCITLLHCVTFYPAPPQEYNLNLLPSLSKIFGVKVGVSDHSTDNILVPVLAITKGACMIEKHVTLDKEGGGLDDKIALDKEHLSLMVEAVRKAESIISKYGKDEGSKIIRRQLKESYSEDLIESVLGDGVKRLSSSEKDNYLTTNRAAHYKMAMREGQVVNKSDVSIVRGEKNLLVGLSPKEYETILGHRLTKDVKEGEGVRWEDFLG